MHGGDWSSGKKERKSGCQNLHHVFTCSVAWEKWRKLGGNVGHNAPCCVTWRTLGGKNRYFDQKMVKCRSLGRIGKNLVETLGMIP